jgi:hypothetical protein
VPHQKPVIFVYLDTNEVQTIEPDSYLTRFDCGEIVPLDSVGREPEIELLCHPCACIRGFRW